jgi:alkylated DNA repair dioxygenase AlkB
MNPLGLEIHELGGGHRFLTGWLPAEVLNSLSFEALWELHPSTFPEIHLHGKRVRLPRWQQAYGVDYHFSGQTSSAVPVPAEVHPVLDWCQSRISPALNGLLLNWYDGRQGHYIGRHRDSTRGLVPSSSIVTVSLGEERIFRLRPWPHYAGAMPTDFHTGNGSVFILPWDTNRTFTHEVTSSTRLTDRRISITVRAFA